MSILDKFQSAEINAAQRQLDELCHKNKIKPFQLKTTGPDSKKWRALVLRMCGLNISDPNWGAEEKEDTDDIGNAAYLLSDFWDVDEKTGKKITKEEIYKEVIRTRKIKPRDMPKGRQAKPRNVVKKALETVTNKRKKPPED